MQGINQTTISGNLTSEPKYVKFENGGQALNFQIANDVMKKKQEEWVKHTNFLSIVAYGRKCEWLAEKLKKGMKVVIDGVINYSEWIGEDGIKRNKIEIEAKNVIPSF